MSLPPASTISRLSRNSLVRFCIVGAASLLTNTGALYLLHGTFRILLPVAATLSFILSFVVNFSLNRVWTFESDGAMFGHLWRYLSLVLVNLGINAALVTALTWLGLPYLLSQVVTTSSLSLLNYLVSDRWIFT